MTPEQTAAEIIAKFELDRHFVGGVHVRSAIATAIRQARVDALEEARVRLDLLNGDKWAGTWGDAMTLAMESIEALKHKGQK
jgi:hypothetical protein